MRKIKGYICLAETLYYERIKAEVPFGKNTGGGEGLYQNFQTNRLTPFGAISEAEKAKEELEISRPYFKKVTVAEIEIRLTENAEDLHFFKNEKNLIVVWLDGKETTLIGRYVEDKIGLGTIPGASLELNGFKTITSLDRAEYIGKEINRQAQCAVWIGTLTIEKL